jgi:hypothetical protein
MKHLLVLALFCGYASAHEFTPTYPEFEPSMLTGIYKADLELFNSREEIEYYGISVYDKDWKPIPFASEDKLIKIDYLGRKSLVVYIRQQDKKRVKYICSKSKILADVKQTSVVASRICSKIK